MEKQDNSESLGEIIGAYCVTLGLTLSLAMVAIYPPVYNSTKNQLESMAAESPQKALEQAIFIKENTQNFFLRAFDYGSIKAATEYLDEQ
ncbi:hypothetical protein CL622_03200 [archaeon]|nr:hypothetical protein [archaeon]|tara:strand:- start:774 stop:1043 length:270 start_codon:yes stop_codon:yes gene_type:complete